MRNVDPYYLVGAFVFSISIFIILSRKSISTAMFTAAVILGITTSPLELVARDVLTPFINPKVISLSIATSIIPMIGGLMNKLGYLDKMIKNLKISRRAFMGIAPAIVGLLPMPGGALLSAPMVEKIGEKDVPGEIVATANVWFRHVFILIYPMSTALIISTEISKISMYTVIPYLSIFAAIAILLGYYSYLRKVPSNSSYEENSKITKFLGPLSILLLAPFIDFTLRTTLHIDSAYSVMIGVLASFTVLLLHGKPGLEDHRAVAKRMKPWEFFFLIIAIYAYLNTFIDSGLPSLIGTSNLNPFILYIVIPFLLGFATGRVMTPVAILFPVYITQLGYMTPIFFATTYVTIFMGYIISPVHPCLVVTAEYFKVDVSKIIKHSALQALIVVIVAAVLLFIA